MELESIHQYHNNDSKSNVDKKKKELLIFLEELKTLESALWGTITIRIKEEEKKLIENAQHLIFLSKQDSNSIKDFLEKKEVKDFLEELKEFYLDFLKLKNKVEEKNRLKHLVTSYTLKLVSKENYPNLEDVFLLERQLHEVIETQDIELRKLILKLDQFQEIENFTKIEIFQKTLRSLNEILSGHLDHHSLWDFQKQAYSNTSNILDSLIDRIKHM